MTVRWGRRGDVNVANMSAATRPTRKHGHDDEWLTSTDLADWLAVPVATVYRWRYVGTGPSGVRVGRHVRYRRSAVEQWLHNRTSRRC